MTSHTFLQRIQSFGSRIAIQDQKRKYTYKELFNNAMNISLQINNKTNCISERLKKILFLTDPDFNYPSVQFGIWASGGVSIPLSIKATQSEIDYYLNDSQADLIVTQNKFADRFTTISSKINILYYEPSTSHTNLINFAINKPTDDSIVIYTSGTTGNPKGVVQTHQGIKNQIEILTENLQWNQNDRILNVLPLHHTHGIVIVMNSALWNSAICELHEKFDPLKVWRAFLRKDDDLDKITLFTAVPTIYYNLLKFYEENSIDGLSKDEIKRRMSRMRVMASGSASLPEAVFQKWKEITGQTILERYGMTETGMNLSNHMMKSRISVWKNSIISFQGLVGYPLPGIKVAIRDITTSQIYTHHINQEGELLIKSPSMFDRYLNKPKETKETFTSDGWFKTGDYAKLTENGMYKILGRLSQDIIKKSGYKISALEIENRILQNENVAEIVVLGVPDTKYGEEIAALVVLKNKLSDLNEVKQYCSQHMSSYKQPRLWKLMKEIPKNAMGKVQKKSLRKLFQEQ